MRFKASNQIRIFHERRGVFLKRVRDRQDDIALFLSRIEDARAIRKSTLLFGKIHYPFGRAIHHAHLHKNVGDFLTVRTHVLHGSPSGKTGYSAETLDTAEFSLHTGSHDTIPVFTRSDNGLGVMPRHAFDSNPQY